MEKINLKKQDQGQAVSSSDQNAERRVRKYIEISEEALNAIKGGKYVEGSLHVDKESGKILFNAWKRKSSRHSDDRVICQLENGWMKESASRYKFFNSVKKEIGLRMIDLSMHRALKTGMQAIAKDRMLAGESQIINGCTTKQ